MNVHHGYYKLILMWSTVLVIHGLHSEGAVSYLVIKDLWAPVYNPWCVVACCDSVLIYEREFEKGSGTALKDRKCAVCYIYSY